MIRPVARGLAVLLALAGVAVAAPAAPAGALLRCPDSELAKYPRATQRYVCALYDDLLERLPSGNEVNYWTFRVDQFGRRPTVDAFIFSVEYMVEEAGAGYTDLLGRPGDPDGLAYWTDRLRTRQVTLESWYQILAETGEHRARFATTADFVRFWYLEVLDRPGDDDAVNYWSGQIDRGALRRSTFVAILQTSAEGVAVTVKQAYDTAFGRTPGQGEIDFWAPVARNRGQALLLEELAVSDEAFARASG